MGLHLRVLTGKRQALPDPGSSTETKKGGETTPKKAEGKYLGFSDRISSIRADRCSYMPSDYRENLELSQLPGPAAGYVFPPEPEAAFPQDLPVFRRLPPALPQLQRAPLSGLEDASQGRPNWRPEFANDCGTLVTAVSFREVAQGGHHCDDFPYFAHVQSEVWRPDSPDPHRLVLTVRQLTSCLSF